MVNEARNFLRAADPLLAPVIDAAGPYQPRPRPPKFEGVVRTICGQQLSTKAAEAIYSRVRALAGGGELTPEHVVALTDESLRSAGLSGAKTRSVRDLAERVLDGRLVIEDLEHFEDEALIETLSSVKGIGRWTAEMLLIFSYGRLDVLPLNDLGIKNAFKRLYDREPTAANLLAMGEVWTPYRSVASWYLWQSLVLPPGMVMPVPEQ